MTQNPFFQRNVISTKDISIEDIKLLFSTADKVKIDPQRYQIPNHIIASCFFEPSTRTRLSFESAAMRLNAKVIGFTNNEGLSVKKGETLADTMRVISAYADLIVIRHPNEGAARLAAEVVDCPVINAGDGSNQHPTQALLDLYTIQQCQSKLDGLSIGLVGDLKHGRTIHSLIELCALFDIRLYMVSPDLLALPDTLCDQMKKQGLRFSFHHTIEEIIPKIDILYMTRIQQERFISQSDYLLVKDQYILKPESLQHAKDNLKILHPLPRINEISADIDDTPYAYYFEQASNGMLIRQALLTLILNESLS